MGVMQTLLLTGRKFVRPNLNSFWTLRACRRYRRGAIFERRSGMRWSENAAILERFLNRVRSGRCDAEPEPNWNL